MTHTRERNLFEPPAYRRLHLSKGTEPLEVKLLRDGKIDADLETGLIYSVRGEKRTLLKINTTEKGYCYVQLGEERSDRQGKFQRDGERRRYRTRRNAFVNRIVKIKAVAVAMGGRNWRNHVRPLPRGVDVNHWNRDRSDNRADNLELATQLANRLRRAQTEGEIDSIHEDVF